MWHTKVRGRRIRVIAQPKPIPHLAFRLSAAIDNTRSPFNNHKQTAKNNWRYTRTHLSVCGRQIQSPLSKCRIRRVRFVLEFHPRFLSAVTIFYSRTGYRERATLTRNHRTKYPGPTDAQHHGDPRNPLKKIYISSLPDSPSVMGHVHTRASPHPLLNYSTSRQVPVASFVSHASIRKEHRAAFGDKILLLVSDLIGILCLKKLFNLSSNVIQ